jgi:hypothetical protein
MSSSSNSRQQAFGPFDEVLEAAGDAAAKLGLGRRRTNAARRQGHGRPLTGWPVDDAAIYGQQMEPPAHRQRLVRGVPGGLGRSPDAAGDADVIEMGGHRPRWPWGSARGPTISIAVAALVAGLLLGFAGGHLQARTKGRPARAATAITTVLPVGGTAVSATGSRCAVQLGHTLQLGIEIMNRSDRTVVLRQIKPVLPLGGLREIASQWRPCGSLPEPGLGQASSLAPGAAGWLTVTFDVMVSCPQPLPVFFKVSFVQASRLVTADLDSFPDLGQVRYNNCTTVPAGR